MTFSCGKFHCAIRHAEGLLAHPAADLSGVSVCLHGPSERQLRVGADECRSAVQRHDLRPWWRTLLSRLRPVRGAIEPVAGSLRRAAVASADHDDLGIAGCRHDVRADADAVLRHALPARRGGGRLFPGRDLLLRWLVPDGVSGTGSQPLLCGEPTGIDCHGWYFRLATRSERGWRVAGLAMVVSRSGIAVRSCWTPRSAFPARCAGYGEVAVGTGEEVATAHLG